jgi:hypothetical protein
MVLLTMRMLAALALIALYPVCAFGQKMEIEWAKDGRALTTTPTLQVVVNPPLRRGSPIHDRTFAELQALGADYVRYVPWLPYPRLGVAELEPPTKDKTSWDFSVIDPMTIDFLNATKGHPVVLNFSTIPQWMFVTPKPVKYPDDPNQVIWDYTQGTELRDPSGKELGDYYRRLVSWYVNGGFTDELGKRHESGHRFKIDYWEVLNEPDIEHNMTPEQYTARYDAIVGAIKQDVPGMKFAGLGLAFPSNDPKMFEYFLNPKNHKPGIPLDMITYHFYASPTGDQSPEAQQFTFFDQADRFIVTVRYIESIRQRLSPKTRTAINEIGSISADDGGQGEPGHVTKVIPQSYWHLSGATYAYLFTQLAPMGIDILGESQLVGYPTQFPSVSMVDWNTGAPNARFRVLELLKNNCSGGGKIVKASIDSPYVATLAYVDAAGKRKVLLVNKRDRSFDVTLPQRATEVQVVDQATANGPPAKRAMNSNLVKLGGYAVAVVTLGE